jgi:hypothetical protein
VLGHLVTSGGIELDKTKIEVIERLEFPMDIKGVRKFSGILWMLQKIHQEFLTDHETLDEPIDERPRFYFHEGMCRSLQ